MTKTEFDQIVADRLLAIQTTLASKGKEYATDDEALHNIKEGAAFRCKSPPAYCMDLMTKHLISVQDIVNSADLQYKKGIDPVISLSLINEKIGDLINYLIILEATLREVRDCS